LLTYRKDVEQIRIDIEADIVNKVYLTYAGGSKTYTDTASIDAYGLREIQLDKTNEIGSVASADDYIDKYFAKKATPQQKISLTVNRQYITPNGGIETINPGDEIVVS
jgi:hypothetical protein